MWIKGRDGNLHETTGCSVCLLKAIRPGRKPEAPAPDEYYLAIVTEEGGHPRLLEPSVTPERGREVLAKIEQAIATRQVLVEV